MGGFAPSDKPDLHFLRAQSLCSCGVSGSASRSLSLVSRVPPTPPPAQPRLCATNTVVMIRPEGELARAGRRAAQLSFTDSFGFATETTRK
jgi:hypothetical protein